MSEEEASLEQSLFTEPFFSKALAFPFIVGDLESCLDNENEGVAAIGLVVTIAAPTNVYGDDLWYCSGEKLLFCAALLKIVRYVRYESTIFS